MCALTHPSDEMVAIASLTGTLRKHTGHSYLAGLWQKDLVDQLCWHRNVYTTLISTRNGYAPSW
ncbi:hypothetical protein N657DRAFT_647247 [Parathielavia appendiculata]|uniref:Uncharacterized protein n=1 Tax=Parathielavia appendiculata TaxID=2587402 RepID=A0AAN6TWF7_9PEZI|nr:hypothetical protein N657DRAFT_647247 [Parathielavia appendiculata]